MELPTVYTNRNSGGFTLIEMLISVAILTVILGLGLFISLNFYRSYSLRSEESVIVSYLQKARSQSMNNINQVKHGVHFQLNSSSSSLQYFIFECKPNTLCNSYTDANTTEDYPPQNPSYKISIITPTLPFDVIFNQLNGATTPISIEIKDGEKSYIISINSDGRIDWQ